MPKDKANDSELETPLYNFYNLNPVDMSYNFSYDTGQLFMPFILYSFCIILQAGPLTGLRLHSTVEM
jgi:hypothetical protein